jgi:hypothetical protein
LDRAGGVEAAVAAGVAVPGLVGLGVTWRVLGIAAGAWLASGWVSRGWEQKREGLPGRVGVCPEWGEEPGR